MLVAAGLTDINVALVVWTTVTFALSELAVGPAIVGVMGILGVAVARWWRSAAGGPVVLVAMAAIQIYLMFQLPNQTAATVRTRSAPYLARYSLGWRPPSAEVRFNRLYADATRCSMVACGIRSPASCSRVNASNGLLPRNARRT